MTAQQSWCGAHRRGALLLLLFIWTVPAYAGGPQAGSLLFVNPCPGGCTFTLGIDDSIANTSSILSGSTELSEFLWGAQTLGEVISCLEGMFAPFDVVVTATDPGSTPHTEIVIAGTPAEAGASSGVLGLAPFACAFQANVPVFAFANGIGNDAETICWTAGQQVGFSFGLDHHFFCEDTMTLLSGCGSKRFVDQDMPCGEFETRFCFCGASTENSFRTLLGLFGYGPALIFMDGFESGNTSRWNQ